jgi:hypothetical protein
VLASLGRPARAMFLSLVLFSVGVEFVGAFLYTGISNGLYFDAAHPDDMRSLWRLENTQYLIEARNPRAPAELYHAVMDLGKPAAAVAAP